MEFGIIAICTHQRDKVGAGCPVFFADTREEAERTAQLLARIAQAAVHDLDNGCFIVFKHKG